MPFLKAIFLLKMFAFLPLALSAQNYYSGIPALFDDFSYTNTRFPIDGDSSNSLFGRNIWLTENGVVSSRAWHRYNWGDPDIFKGTSSIETTPDGIALKVFKGFPFKNVTPSVSSGFLFKSGTFVSKVKFSQLSEKTNSIQAFWLATIDSYRFKSGNDSITYTHEVDIEWNNWFMGRGEKRVNTGIIWAYHTKNPEDYSSGKVMRFFQKNTSGGITYLGPDVDRVKDFENRWFYFMIRLDSVRNTTEFLMQSSDEGDNTQTIYGGDNYHQGELLPVKITGNFPRYDLCTIYNCGMWPLDSRDTAMDIDMSLDADWFYYSPQTDLALDQVLKEVNNFKKQDIPRINTTGKATFHDTTIHLKAPSVIIEGPSDILPLQFYSCSVRPSLKNTLYDVEYMYRRISPTDSSDWIPLEAPNAETYARAGDTAMEWRAIVKDWRGMTASTSKIIKVHPLQDISHREFFPNPTSGIGAVKIPEVFKNKEITVRIFTVEGKKIQEFTTKQANFITVDLSGDPAGQYTVTCTTGNDVFKSTITIIR